MGYFDNLNVAENRKRQEKECSIRMHKERADFIAQASPVVIEILREFARKAPTLVPYKFTLVPTHRRRFTFLNSGTAYQPVIEMPEVMMIRFGVGLASVESDLSYWNEVFLDKAGRFHCCERMVVLYGDQGHMMCCVYKGALYERNLARSIIEGHLHKSLSPDMEWAPGSLDVNEFTESLIRRLEVYLLDDR